MSVLKEKDPTLDNPELNLLFIMKEAQTRSASSLQDAPPIKVYLGTDQDMSDTRVAKGIREEKPTWDVPLFPPEAKVSGPPNPERKGKGGARLAPTRSSSFSRKKQREKNTEPPPVHLAPASGAFRSTWDYPEDHPGKGSPLTVLLEILAAVILLGLIFFAVGLGVRIRAGQEGAITLSTVRRQKLPEMAVVKLDTWYDDRTGSIQDAEALEQGLNHFFERTGIQPYFYLTDKIWSGSVITERETEIFANSLYEQLFEDEAHLLVIYQTDVSDSSRIICVAGLGARTIFDDEAAAILKDCLELAQKENPDPEQFVPDAFVMAADRMMRITYDPVPIILILMVVLIGVLIILQRRQMKKGMEGSYMFG